MILIETFHRSVRDVVLEQFQSHKNFQENPADYPKPQGIVANIADFDGVLYTIKKDCDDSTLIVSISLKFYKEIQQFCDSKVLEKEYGSYLKSVTDGESSITLAFDCNSLPANLEELAEKAASLRRNCFASIYTHFFDYQISEKAKTANIQGIIHYRTDETMFVQAMADRVTVIFSTVFRDSGDIVLGKIFLQEFTEAKRRFDGAPQVLYCHKNPPKELEGTDAASGDNVAYITLVLSPRHFSEKNRGKTIDLVHTLRTYMHYHIKCMKAYMQMRMRSKTSEFLKVLNRAFPGGESGPTNYVVDVSNDLDKTGPLGRSVSLRKSQHG